VHPDHPSRRHASGVMPTLQAPGRPERIPARGRRVLVLVLVIAVVIVAAVAILRATVAVPIWVDSPSMLPTFGRVVSAAVARASLGPGSAIR
jgi:hypothetical protein